jgi:hypothetical protein
LQNLAAAGCRFKAASGTDEQFIGKEIAGALQARLAAGCERSRRSAAAVTLFSSAMTARVISRLRSN